MTRALSYLKLIFCENFAKIRSEAAHLCTRLNAFRLVHSIYSSAKIKMFDQNAAHLCTCFERVPPGAFILFGVAQHAEKHQLLLALMPLLNVFRLVLSF